MTGPPRSPDRQEAAPSAPAPASQSRGAGLRGPRPQQLGGLLDRFGEPAALCLPLPEEVGLGRELPRLGPQVDEDRDLRPQHPRVEGLGQIVDGADGVAAQGEVGVPVGRGEKDDRDVPGALTALDVTARSRIRPCRASARPAG